MSGIKEVDIAFQAAGKKITPDEIDRYEQYVVLNPSISTTFFGTAAGGTSTQAKALVVISKTADYPRNLLYGVIGTGDMGGTWVVNGKDQFGNPQTETVALGTAAAGTPAVATAGTLIFAEVNSGTFTVATGAVGAGSATLGVAIGTAAGSIYKLGLPTKIGAVADVKRISWTSQGVGTVLGGGTIGTAYVDLTNHAFTSAAPMAGTETFVVTFKTTYDNSGKASFTGKL